MHTRPDYPFRSVPECLAVLSLLLACSSAVAQSAISVPTSGWSRGPGAAAHATAEAACTENIDQLRMAYRAEVVFTGDLKRAKAGNARYCEYEITRGGRVTRIYGQPVYDLSISQLRR